MNETVVVIVRGIIGFFSLLIFARLLGKQQISHLTFFEYVLGITIGSIAASLTTELSSRAWIHFVGLVVWAVSVLVLQLLTQKSRYAAKYMDGEPTVVVMNGKIMEDAMRKMRYRALDLMQQLRDKGIFDLNEVEFAILEVNGKLSVLKKPQFQPVTPQHLNITSIPNGIATELIYDGQIIKQNLKDLNITEEWLDSQLEAKGINDISEVFLATITPDGSFFVDTYMDRLKRIIDISDYPGPN
ncbi:MAG: DUF421 domain-containing protein [Thermoanaerobacteraceae bacterium]|nr:DUF421 domain-containing protein [Thermoanaerobacteraceae bacterium]